MSSAVESHVLYETSGNLLEANYRGRRVAQQSYRCTDCRKCSGLFREQAKMPVSYVRGNKRRHHLEYSAHFNANHITNSRLKKKSLFFNLSARWIPTRLCVAFYVCAFVYTRPGLPLLTSYLGRCSSLHPRWSCSKPWRSPESSPGLDQSSTHLEKSKSCRGAIRDQQRLFEVC